MMAPVGDGVINARQIDPSKLDLPQGVDPIAFLLSMPAFSEDQIPPGADRKMTLDGPDQFWFLFVAITCIAIPGLFLIVRVYTKAAIVKSFELADYFLFIAFPLIVVEVVMGYNMVRWGAGVHQWQVTTDQLFHQLYWANLGQIIYCPLSFVVKMAILLQYLRLFAPSRSVNRVMWYGAWATIFACFVLYTVLMFWTMFYCRPRHAIWDKLTPNAKCHDVNHIILAQGAFNMGSDIIILLLPTSGLWRLNVPLARKIAVTLLFATGLLACAASAMRIVFTVRIAPVISQADVSHNGLFIGLWTEVEVSLGFVCACALCLPKLIQAKGMKLKRAISKASSPFSSLRGTIHTASRKSTFHSSSPKSTQVASRTSIQADHIQRNRPMAYEEPRIEQAQQLQPQQGREDYRYSSPAGGSSTYSQSPEPKPPIPEKSKARWTMTPLHVPRASSSDIYSDLRSSTYRASRDQMSADQIEREIQSLQQFNFDMVRQSMEDAVRGSRPTSYQHHNQ